jgi:hypothetical protein
LLLHPRRATVARSRLVAPGEARVGWGAPSGITFGRVPCWGAARSCREYFFVTYSGKAYSVDPGEKCNRYKRILASSVPKLPQLRPVIVRWSTLFRPRFAA